MDNTFDLAVAGFANCGRDPWAITEEAVEIDVGRTKACVWCNDAAAAITAAAKE